MEEMPYKICCDMKVIAQFKHESDRNVAIDALRDFHDDCEFTVLNSCATQHQPKVESKKKTK